MLTVRVCFVSVAMRAGGTGCASALRLAPIFWKRSHQVLREPSNGDLFFSCLARNPGWQSTRAAGVTHILVFVFSTTTHWVAQAVLRSTPPPSLPLLFSHVCGFTCRRALWRQIPGFGRGPSVPTGGAPGRHRQANMECLHSSHQAVVNSLEGGGVLASASFC